MADKKPSGFRFRLPWILQPSSTPAKEPPTRSARTTTQTSVASTPAQRPPFRPPGKAPPPAPVAAPPMVATSAPASPEQSPPQSVSPPPSVLTKSSAPKSPIAKSIEPVAMQPAKETQTSTETTQNIETAATASPPQTPSFRPPTQAQSQPSPPQTPPAAKPNSQPSSPSHLSTPPQLNSKPLSPSHLPAQIHEATPPRASSKPPSPVHSPPAHTRPRSPSPTASQPTDKPSTLPSPSPLTETTGEVPEIKRLIETTKEKVQVDSNHVPQSGDLALDAKPREITKVKGAQTKSMDPHSIETKSQKPKPVSAAQVPLHREIKDDISKFIHKVATSSSKQTMDEKPASVITIAGDNTGASMHVGVDAIKRGNKLTIDSTAHDAHVNGDRSPQRDSKASENQETKAIVNSNIQGINNSMMFNSSVTERNPGVHLGFYRNLANNSNSKMKNTKSMEMQRAEVNITPPQEFIYNLATESLLGGLFMEPSNSEADDPETSGKGHEIEVL